MASSNSNRFFLLNVKLSTKANLLLSIFLSPLKFFETDASGIATDQDLPRVRRWKSSALSPLPTLEPEQKRQVFGMQIFGVLNKDGNVDARTMAQNTDKTLHVSFFAISHRFTFLHLYVLDCFGLHFSFLRPNLESNERPLLVETETKRAAFKRHASFWWLWEGSNFHARPELSKTAPATLGNSAGLSDSGTL